MFQVGDIVKHYKLQSRVGFITAIDKNTILVDWFDRAGRAMSFRYYDYALIKVS